VLLICLSFFIALSLLDLLAFPVTRSFGCSCSAGAEFFSSNYVNVYDNLLLVANVSIC